MKNLRKQSSLFVKETFAPDLRNQLEEFGIGDFCIVEPQADGEGDGTLYKTPSGNTSFAKGPYYGVETEVAFGTRLVIIKNESRLN